VVLTFQEGGYESFRVLRDQLLRGCGFGADPVIVVAPTAADPEVWMYSRLPMEAGISQLAQIWHSDQITLVEMPFPTWV
jgi:hypothetical protein